jgi:hypothetical protein
MVRTRNPSLHLPVQQVAIAHRFDWAFRSTSRRLGRLEDCYIPFLTMLAVSNGVCCDQEDMKRHSAEIQRDSAVARVAISSSTLFFELQRATTSTVTLSSVILPTLCCCLDPSTIDRLIRGATHAVDFCACVERAWYRPGGNMLQLVAGCKDLIDPCTDTAWP